MAIEILRPNAPPGDLTELIPKPGTGEANWEDVDEAVSDNDTTRVQGASQESGEFAGTDLYNLPPSSGSGTINKVTVKGNLRTRADPPDQASAKLKLKTGGVVYEGEWLTLAFGYVVYSEEWAQNPGNAHAWTWDEIDALQIGVYLQSGLSTDNFKHSHATQIWVEVDYTPIIHYGAVTLSGVGTLTGVGRGTFIGKTTLSGVGTLTAIGRRIFTGVAVLAGSGALAAVGRLTAIGKATLAGVGTLSGLGGFLHTATATLSGIGTLTAVGQRIRYGLATFTGQGTLVGKGVITAIGKATLAGVGNLAVIGNVIEILLLRIYPKLFGTGLIITSSIGTNLQITSRLETNLRITSDIKGGE